MQIYDWNNEQLHDVTPEYKRKVAVGEKLMMAQVSLEKGVITNPHSHFQEEIIHVIKGKWRMTLGAEEIILEDNQTIVVPSNIEHSSEALEDTQAIVFSSSRPEWLENNDYMLHYNADQYLWAV
jgi:quercetin dioxygenase-like cupin family protein